MVNDIQDLKQLDADNAPTRSEQAKSTPALEIERSSAGEGSSSGVSSGSRDHHPLLVVAVVSARSDRRHAIRQSWLAWGDERVELRFFTELPEPGSADEAALEEESECHGDLVLMDIDRGMNFALKLVWAMRWMSQQFTFEFFLRLDDDYFLCLQRLLDELEVAIAKTDYPSPIYAGHLYCEDRTRIDEAYLLLSADLVHRVLETPDLKCGTHAGVTAGWWFTEGNPINPLGDVQWVHDMRLDHPGHLLNHPEGFSHVCSMFMGVHRVYSDMMPVLWEAAKDEPGPAPGATGTRSSVLAYVENDRCNRRITGAGVTDHDFNKNHAQPCATFSSKKTDVYCGREGC